MNGLSPRARQAFIERQQLQHRNTRQYDNKRRQTQNSNSSKLLIEISNNSQLSKKKLKVSNDNVNNKILNSKNKVLQSYDNKHDVEYNIEAVIEKTIDDTSESQKKFSSIR